MSPNPRMCPNPRFGSQSGAAGWICPSMDNSRISEWDRYFTAYAEVHPRDESDGVESSGNPFGGSGFGEREFEARNQ